MKKLLLLTLLSFHVLAGFTTLQDAEHYASTLTENPSADNTLALSPDYTSWYRAQRPGLLASLLDSFGIRKLPWSTAHFKQLVSSLVTAHAKKDEKPSLLIMRPRPGTQFIIFGPVYGSFHSLVRSLRELERRGTITTTFKIKEKNTFIVFDGNVIDKSPYIMETLSLVLKLLEINPENVFYLAGTHENDNYWKGNGLKTELDERAGDPQLEQLLTHLFAQLPRGLILMSPQEGEGALAIADLKLEKIGRECSKKMQTLAPGDRITCPTIEKGKELPVLARIQGEKRLMTYVHNQGLALVPEEAGALTWSVFSAPNAIYQKYFNFYFDAFVVLTIASSFDRSTLELINQDIRTKQGFKRSASFAVETGQPLKDPHSFLTKTEAEKKPILLGCSLDLSKGASGQGKLVKLGISLCVNEQNQKGGIHGRRLEVIFMDDEYSPDRARKNVTDFVKKYKSTLFLCNLGSPTVQACLDLIKEGKIFIFFPVTEAPLFRKPGLSVVHWTTSYKNEALALTEYTLHNSGIKDIAFLYQNDSYGLGALEGSREALKKYPGVRSKEVSYERNSTDFKNAIDQVKAASPDALGFFATALASEEFIRQIGVEFFIGKKVFGLSDLAELSFKKFMSQKGIDVVVAEFAPNPVISSLEIVKEYRKALYSYGLANEDVFMLEGYISTALTIDILTKAADTSHKSIQEVITSMKDYPFKGLTLTYNPQTRELAHKLWLDVGTPDWIEQKIA